MTKLAHSDEFIEEVGRQFIELAIKNTPEGIARDRLRQALTADAAPPLPGPPVNPSFNDLIGDRSQVTLTRMAEPFVSTTTPAGIPPSSSLFTTAVAPRRVGPPPLFDSFSGGEFRVGHADEWYRVGRIRNASVRANTRSHFSSHSGVRERDYVQFLGYRLDATLDDVDRNASGFLIDAYNNHEPVSPVSLLIAPDIGRAYQLHIASLHIDRLTLSNSLEIYLGGTISGEMNMTELPS